LNGNKAYSKISLDKFIATDDEYNGKTLLHYRSEKRASQNWRAFLIKHEGLEITDAQKSRNLSIKTMGP